MKFLTRFRKKKDGEREKKEPSLKEIKKESPSPFSIVKESQPLSEGEISPKELKALQEKGEVQILDVRERWEWDICHIEGATLIPLTQLPDKTDELDKNKFIATHCHTGVRSLEAQKFLKEKGFKTKSLKGGIEKWAEEIEPDMQRY